MVDGRMGRGRPRKNAATTPPAMVRVLTPPSNARLEAISISMEGSSIRAGHSTQRHDTNGKGVTTPKPTPVQSQKPLEPIFEDSRDEGNTTTTNEATPVQ